jgi:hypothetical protein
MHFCCDNDLLFLNRCKHLKHIVKHQQKPTRVVNQAKLQSFWMAPRYKYGYQVLRDYQHAKDFDLQNDNTMWQDATDLEMSQLEEYDTFKDLGYKASTTSAYKKICMHLVYDIKHNGWYKARMVADEHLMAVPVEGVYSGVVLLQSLCSIVFLVELLETWSTNIGNTYLKAETKEKVYIIATILSLVSSKGIPLPFSRHSITDSGLQAHAGMSDLPTVIKTWSYTLQGRTRHLHQNTQKPASLQKICGLIPR